MTDDREVRIRLLGDLEVVRRDGTIVPPDAWRTGKTMDLLRLLALSNGRPVSADSLVAKLWPGVSAERARVSLRTATSQIRRAVEVDCVGRTPGALVLEGAWVDAEDFRAEARRARVACRLGDHAQALAAARSADQLYRGDFHAHADDHEWARAEREHIALARVQMLCDGASAALELGEFREGLRLASTAVRADPYSEPGHQALMRAYAELGDIGSALRVFELFRARLAENLDAHPSSPTLALHARLQRGRPG